MSFKIMQIISSSSHSPIFSMSYNLKMHSEDAVGGGEGAEAGSTERESPGHGSNYLGEFEASKVSPTSLCKFSL